MDTIQLALSDTKYCERLQRMLVEDRGLADCKIERVSLPELQKAGVWVIDSRALDRIGLPLPHPERVVLISRNTPEHLTRAWKAGIISLVFEHDPPGTAMLAILAARYRACKPAA